MTQILDQMFPTRLQAACGGFAAGMFLTVCVAAWLFLREACMRIGSGE